MKTTDYNLTGALPYQLTNDYLFRAILQSNQNALEGLICALLNLKIDDILECIIENPIELGKERKDKTSILDVKILLNHNERINIELQVTDEGNWPDRSLFYLCRTFADLKKTQNYGELKRTVHVGILDFQLFEDVPDFYSQYLLMNSKNGKIYNSKFEIRVLQLSQIHTIPVNERNTDLYYWAMLFKAKSWEEIYLLAEKNEIIRDTTTTIRQLTADEKIKLQCEAEEQYQHEMRSAKDAGREEGREEGRAEERKNTEREKARADAAELEIANLKKIISQNIT